MVIELPTLQPIEQMIETGQSLCAIGDVVIQNGVTTNQVQWQMMLCEIFWMTLKLASAVLRASEGIQILSSHTWQLSHSGD